ncbi:MAG: YfhO family protein [Eubacteriales bacterium]|nr:YfhO family protein [Eubacteriales bacterium]
MDVGEIARITKELEDLLMTEDRREKSPVEQLMAEMESAVARVEAAGVRQETVSGGRSADEVKETEKAQENDEARMTDKTQKEDKAQEADQVQETEKEQEASVLRPLKKSRGRRLRDGSRAWNGGAFAGGITQSGGGLAAAFFVPVLIMILIFVQRGIFPFGEESFLRTDMYHQYAPFFSEFQYKLTHGGSLLYSWDVGMGVNFSALYAYYLASPLNWLLILCPGKLVIEFMTYSIVFKIGLSGLSMAYYLKRHCRTNDFGIAFFGIFYALSGYMAAYSWNIMWLDCIWLFPLIVLGLERLVHDGKGMLYCLALGLSILSNYYISIMTCIFMVMYFAALLVLERYMTWEKFISRLFRFMVYSLLAGGLAAAVLLPEIYALQATASGDVNFPKTFSEYFPVFDMLARHIGNVETEIGLDHWPNIYCGVAVLMLFLLYLSCRRIRRKEKAVMCVLLLFFMASFSINVLNFIWHGFHYPNSLPCRQSYIYIFLVLLACYRAYMYLREMPWNHIAASFGGASAFVLMAQKLVTSDHYHFVVFYVALLFLALYLGVIWLYRRGRRYRNAALFCGLLLVSVEAAVNTTVTSVTTTSRTAYMDDNEEVERLAASVTPNETFYRMEKVTRKTKNDGAWMHFPSVSLFSSTANADLSRLFTRLGCESSTNAYSITGSTPLVDSLFSVKYGIYSSQPDPSGIRTPAGQDGDTWLYENTFTLPLGFFVDSDFEEDWDLDTGNPADVQNSLADSLGTEHVLEMVMDTVTNGKTMTFTPEEGGEYYAYVGSRSIEKITASTWKGTKTFNNVDRGYLLELGYCAAGEPVTLTAEDTKEELWADVYRFSENGLKAVYEKLSAHPWKLTSWTDTSLEGSISCEEGGIMLTTIPYDKGWTILVDGVEQPAVPMLNDAFTGVRLTPGSHRISMEYRPEGLNAGWVISLSSAALLAAIAAAQVLLYRRKEHSYVVNGNHHDA